MRRSKAAQCQSGIDQSCVSLARSKPSCGSFETVVRAWCGWNQRAVLETWVLDVLALTQPMKWCFAAALRAALAARHGRCRWPSRGPQPEVGGRRVPTTAGPGAPAAPGGPSGAAAAAPALFDRYDLRLFAEALHNCTVHPYGWSLATRFAHDPMKLGWAWDPGGPSQQLPYDSPFHGRHSNVNRSA